MEDILRPIYQERASNRNTMGILVMEKKKEISPETDNFDSILLVVVKDLEEKWIVKHYEFKEQSAALHVIDRDLLEEWIEQSTYRRAVEWIIDGKIIYDRNEYLAELKETLRVFPSESRKLRLMIEFSKLTRSYAESRDLFESGNYLDAYSRLLRSLHYLGRITILDKGYYPEVLVWNQIKRIDPEVYKLYEELVRSTEEMNKRVELMLIAIDFAINQRAEICAEHLLEIMKTRETPWGFGELKTHPDVMPYMYDLVSVVDYLISKDMIEVVLEETKSELIRHRKYQIARK
ncbi:nucleotidyltransferase-like protein [Gracilibacillus sp. S3-1-1]|uniref:Nucleotidyltransferase-like protein n=1 Tax=Gracilibacillus pellucidus TaxID=3095368 RepID=A0ACC6M9S5_9BACI|nr:nucleotidyltransferase-like protein [Gracilibacillus sp. S3-1-1]MDX8047641.1 nucleotidyltransferase-like protein [Gracilibacillus sp. S3-1-1]